VAIDPDTAVGYLRDLGPLLLDLVEPPDATWDDFDKGKRFGLLMAVSLMQQQALAFQIDLDDIGLGSVDPDNA
jgi:hypothetical protein